MPNEKKLKVIMLGPDRGVHGGISAMVNSYYEAGLDERVELKYIGTMKEGSRIKKLLVAVCAYLIFTAALSKYDIVHVNASSDNSFWRKSYFIRYAKKHGKKIILHQHGGDFKNYYANVLNDSRKEKVRQILDMTDKMLVLTPSWREYFGTLADINKITVLPNGVKIPESIDAKGGDINKILFLGRICKDKGIYELIDAVRAVRERHPKVRLYLGGIYEDADFEKLVDENSDFITYTGWVSGKEKEKYLSECGILALPSYYEGFPVSVLDGMLSGLIVVASAVGGIPEIVTDRRDGILIKPRNVDEIRNALLNIYDGNIPLDDMRQNASEKVRQEYSIDNITERLVKTYEEM